MSKMVHLENVPGVLSLERGKIFGTILRKMVKLRYGIAYRVLDARDFGCAQARPRVFVVGHSSGDYAIPARVLGIRPSCDYNSSRSKNETGRIPTLTLRNAGLKNARGLAIVEEVMQESGANGSFRDTEKWQIRACTPWEEERRQGFSGIHTAIDGAVDSERYEAIGNSMAVPVMRWLGEQIQKEEEFLMGRERKTCVFCNTDYGRDAKGHKDGRCVNKQPEVIPQSNETVAKISFNLETVIQNYEEKIRVLQNKIAVLKDCQNDHFAST